MISQIVMQTHKPVDAKDERLKILPNQGILRKLVESWSDSMLVDKKIQAVIDGDDENHELAPNESKVKMLLYKFFFFNYVLEVTGDDVLESLTSAESGNALKEFARDMPEIPVVKPLSAAQMMPDRP